jgi:4-amino-4-deoxy-L-arabinose transferase-like glycosyltransferase
MTRPGTARPWGWGCLFYLSLALGFLAKGPVAWLPLGGVALGRWFRPAAFRLCWLGLAGGLLASVAVIGLWAVPALLATHGEYYRVGIGRHVIQRSFDVLEGHGASGWLGYGLTVPLYFVTIFVSLFPWALGLPAALRRWWPGRGGDALGWYLLVQGALVFGVFSLVRTKLPHYTLPAFPCLALWLALRESAAPESMRRLARGLFFMIALTLLLTVGLFSVARSHLIAANLWRQVSPHARPEMQAAAIGFKEPSLVWELRRRLTGYVEYLPPEQAADFLARPGPRLLVVPTPEAGRPLLEVAPGAICVRATGLDTVQFKQHELTAIIRP